MRPGPGILATWALAAALAVWACQERATPGPGGVLATYGGGEITREELDAHLAGRAAAGGPAAGRPGRWQTTILEELAWREIVDLRAEQRGDRGLEGRIARARDGVYEEAMRRRLGWHEIEVSEDEVRRYYDQHPEVFIEPEKLRLQHIYVRSEESLATADERAAARQKLEGVRRQILEGADFTAMAQRHSDSTDGPAGGWMSLRRGARAVRAFTDAAWALETDEVSEVIETSTGFHIARLATRIPAVEQPFEAVRDRAAAAVRQASRRRLEEDYLAAKAPVHGLTRNYPAIAVGDVGDDTVLFSIDGDAFTVADFLAVAPKEYLPHLFSGYLEHLPRVLDELALGRILVREATAAGIPEETTVREQVARAVASVRAGAEIERLLAERVRQVPEAELRDHFELNEDRFELPRRRSLSIIRLAPEEDRSLRQVLDEGERLADDLRSGADFGETARRVSRHPSARDGGRLAEQRDEDLQLRLQGRARGRKIVDQLAVGEISSAFIGEVYDPQRLQFVPSGVYIVRLDEELPPRQPSFEEVEEAVRADYLRRHRKRLLSELRARTLAASGFEVIGPNVAAVDG